MVLFEPQHYQTKNDFRQVTISLGSPVRQHTDYVVHMHKKPLWLVSAYGKLKQLSGRSLSQAGFLFRVTVIEKISHLRNCLRITRHTASYGILLLLHISLVIFRTKTIEHWPCSNFLCIRRKIVGPAIKSAYLNEIFYLIQDSGENSIRPNPLPCSFLKNS